MIRIAIVWTLPLRGGIWHAVSQNLVDKVCRGASQHRIQSKGAEAQFRTVSWHAEPPTDVAVCPRCVAALVRAQEKIKASQKGAA
jgi:hypothetical protein